MVARVTWVGGCSGGTGERALARERLVWVALSKAMGGSELSL